MSEGLSANEIREKLEQFEAGHGEEKRDSWNKYLAITTAFIAVIAAVFSLYSSYLADRSLLEKNDAILAQSQASDQWAYYQAKGIKRSIAEGFSDQINDPKRKEQAERYAGEQEDIRKKAEAFEKKVGEKNEVSRDLFEKHHKMAVGVTMFEIAIALSALSALMRRKAFWVFSIAITIVGFVLAFA
jgi:hypothetical protein